MDSAEIDFAVVHNDNKNNHILRASADHGDILACLSSEINLPSNSAKKWMAGVDEAGRGPVLGPMVYCICAVPACDEANQFLKACGCADSKVLSEQQREGAFKRMAGKVIWIAKVLSPVYLSREMLRPTKISLNAISHDAARELTDLVASQLVSNESFLKQLFVDTVGPPEKYQQKLLEFFPRIDVTVSKKADSLYPVVSAASIIAKIIRDAVLKNWRFEINVPIPQQMHSSVKRAAEQTEVLVENGDKRETRAFKRQKSSAVQNSESKSVFLIEEPEVALPTLPDKPATLQDNDSHAENFAHGEEADFSASVQLVYGSGYPGDPKTKSYLAANCDPVFGFSSIVRFSWQTAQTLMDKSKGGPVLSWPDDVPEDQSWQPSGSRGGKTAQAGAMEKFVTKQRGDGDAVPATIPWRQAKYYREKQLNSVRWPA